MSKYAITILLVLFYCSLHAQYDHQAVFPELEGEELLQAVIQNYKPTSVLSFGDSRDTLFAKIDSKDNILRCVYSGHEIELDPNEDPTQSAYQDGAATGINTEHTYPQSKGASVGFARSDMHHLFPTRSGVNSARGNDPFREIEDSETSNWYYLADSQQSIPTDSIDLYSEDTSNGFEPREDHKGNVARSMFYFFTMYQQEALGASPSYFEDQKETLCNWHYQDPVDETEWNRTQLIAPYQDGKENPFVLDCSLANRLYCPVVDDDCRLVNTEEKIIPSPKVYPNPSNNQYRINWLEKYNVLLTDAHGNILILQEGFNETVIDVPSLPGYYFLLLNDGKGKQHMVKLVRM